MTGIQIDPRATSPARAVKDFPPTFKQETRWAEVSGLGGRMAEYLLDWLENNGYERRVDWTADSRWTVHYRPAP